MYEMPKTFSPSSPFAVSAPAPPAYEHRAQLLFDRLEADGNPLDTDEKDCINDLLFVPMGAAGFIDLSDDTGASDRWKVMHFKCMGSAAKDKYNILQPIDADANFRKTDFGGWTYANTGETPNGINAYSRTYWNFKTQGMTNKGTYYHYIRTNSVGGGQIGVFDANTGTFLVSLQGFQDQHMSIGQLPDYLVTATGPDSDGGWMATHTAVTAGENFRNGVSINTISNILGVGVDGENYYGARLVAGPNVIDQYDNREECFSGFSLDGHNAADALSFHTIVINFLTAWFAL